MSQGKAGRIPRYVRGTDAASCSALPDPGCSCGASRPPLEGEEIHTTVRFLLCWPRLPSDLYIYFFFFLASNFPICWRNSPLGTSKVQPGAAGPAPRLPRPEEGCVGQSCPGTPCCPRGVFFSPETKLLEKRVATRALQEILSRSDAFGASANAACFPSCLFLKDCFSCVPKVPGS